MSVRGTRQLYRKLFGIYSVIILGVVLIMVTFFIQSTKARVRDTNLDYLKMMQEKSVSYLESCSEITDNIKDELYQSDDILKDLLYYLRNDDSDYLERRLDRYYEGSSLTYNGFDSFTEKCLNNYGGEILHIDYYAYGRQELSCFFPDNKTYKNIQKETYLENIKNGNPAKDGEFAFLKEIRDQDTMENVGCMMVFFSAERFGEFKDYYGKPEILVVNGDQTVVWNTLTGIEPKEILAADKVDGAESLTGSVVDKGSIQDYTVYTFLDKSEADRIPVSLFLMVMGTAGAVIIVGESLVYWYLCRLTNRLNYILDGMEKVTVGDLKVRLQIAEKGDELDVISLHFNEMCEKLDRYIQQSYLAEISQRDAEMEVLQNQINPHFLYNTLEAIRMKAVINKDKDVAKMLYSMAVIYRSQLKDADMITLVQELHYCKKYLELFEYRYKDKFVFTIDCPEEYMNYSVIKFIVQPVLENYFAHGIRGEKEGNEIHIYVEKKEQTLLIHIEDNGMGIEDEKLKEMDRKLRENTETSRKSIGLTNVNRRLKAVYGASYGVELRKGELEGLHVVLKVGLGEENEEKADHAD